MILFRNHFDWILVKYVMSNQIFVCFMVGELYRYLNICFQHRPRHLCMVCKMAICKHIEHGPLKSILDVSNTIDFASCCAYHLRMGTVSSLRAEF